MAKAARSHHCHAAFQLVVRFDRHRAARHHLGHRSLLRIEPGQQHFYGAVTLGHDTDQYVVVDGPGCRASGARLRRPCRRNEHGSRRHSSGPERFLLCSSISCRGPCPAPPRWSALEVSRNILPCQHRADVAVLTEGAMITYAPKWIGLHERSGSAADMPGWGLRGPLYLQHRILAIAATTPASATERAENPWAASNPASSR